MFILEIPCNFLMYTVLTDPNAWLFSAELISIELFLIQVEQKRAEEWCTTTTTPSKDKKNRPRNVNIESKCAVEQQGALLQQQEVLLQQQGR